MIKEKEQNINNVLFKKYLKYQSPANMYNKKRRKTQYSSIFNKK